ncbi:MAG: hypothetical protein ACODAE_02720 [Gemmatimonadota bacterium]
MANDVVETAGPADAGWAIRKRRAVRGFVVLALLLGVALALVPEGSVARTVVGYVASLVVIGLSLLWVVADSVEGDHPLGRPLLLVILVAPFVGVPVYALRSRGVRGGGAVVVARIVALLALMVVIIASVQTALTYLFPLRPVP